MKVDYLTSDICYLIPFSEEHLADPSYLDWLQDYDVVKTLNKVDYLRPVSKEEVVDYCKSVMESRTDMFFAIYDGTDDKFLGTLRVAQINWRTRTADIGIMIGDRNKWGCGMATGAIRLICRHLFSLGFRRLTSGLMVINVGMHRVFSKFGFKDEACLREHDFYEGRYVDHILLGCMDSEFTDISKPRKSN